MTGAAAFSEKTDVSRETMDRLQIYAALLEKWNPAINLVSKTTINQLWARHFLDSAQVFDAAPLPAAHWADLGSGGGFPGLVAAVLAQDHYPQTRFTLVESDQRKATFLRTAAREMGVAVTVLVARAELVPPLGADVLSARALAPLTDLLSLAERHLVLGGVALFPKGEKAQAEVQQALASWRFVVETLPSKTEPSAAILKVGGISRV